MSFRESLAVSVAPIPLRIGLAVVFITTGAAKLLVTQNYEPEQAAALANMGVDVRRASSSSTIDEEETPEPGDAEAIDADPAPTAGILPEWFRPPVAAATTPRPQPPLPDVPAPDAEPQPDPAPDTAPDPAPPSAPTPGPASTPAPTRVPDADVDIDAEATEPAGTHTAADFPDGARLRKLYGVALMLASNGPDEVTLDDPATAEREGPKFALVPRFAAEGSWPVYLAWTLGVTELAGGILVLIGLLTRIGALGLFGAMTGAIWLTELGPALANDTAIFRFIPPPHGGPWHDPSSYMHFFFQVVLWCSSLALLLAGAGTISFDRLFFGRPGGYRNDPDDD